MHIPVLLNEVIELLDPKNDQIIVDATVNGGGHTGEILKKEDFNGQIIGIDQDENLLNKLKDKFDNYIKNGRLKLIRGNFKDIKEYLKNLGVNKIDGAIFDLGMSSFQIEESGRGFSFLRDEPLIMSFKSVISEDDLTAEKIVNEWPEYEIARILKEYGEERFAGKIARNIAETRKKNRIKTTKDLVQIIIRSLRRGKIHPATRTFQALRIAVNDELNTLKDGLKNTFDILDNNGRIAVISFHSLEDRVVKNFFKDLKADGRAEILTKKPIMAKREEIHDNPRSRSAKLRGIIKIKKSKIKM